MPGNDESHEDLQALRGAKQALHEKYGGCAWFRGVGIGRSDAGLGLRLNVDPTVPAQEGEVPTSFQGFPIDIVYIRAYKPRKEDQ